MKEKSWVDDITIEDIDNEDLQLIAQKCGIKVLRSLLKHCQGSQIYIPRKFCIKKRNEYIKKKYDGTRISAIKLAREFHIGYKYVIEIINS